MNFDEQIAVLKNWIDQQLYPENFTIKDKGDDGYYLYIDLDNGIHVTEYPIFDSDMFDGDKYSFIEQLETGVQKSLTHTKVDIELYIEDL